MSQSVEGRVIIVTGSSGAIGLAYVGALLRAGAAVVMADFDKNAEVEAILLENDRALFVPTDVREPAQTQEMVRLTEERFGKVDGLVNNAALFTTLERKPFEELTVPEWEHVLSVNVVGTFNCVRAVTPGMKARRFGRIINVASNVVHKGLPRLLHYVASKGAVIAMTRSLARELGPFGVTVNAIAPGYIYHKGTMSTDGGRNEQVKALRSIPETETPEDLVGTLVFLCSGASRFMSGQTLLVDGGEIFA